MKDRKSLYIEVDMLRGNINRMCVTDDFEELVNMKNYAIRRLESIYEFCKSEILEK